MSTADEDFSDLLPHRVKVSGAGGYDDYGRPIAGAGDRTYRCLIDDTTSTIRNAAGEEIVVALTAYISPVPVGAVDGLPIDIESTESVEILSPRVQTRPVTSIERHYDSDNGVGMLHNLVVRFS